MLEHIHLIVSIWHGILVCHCDGSVSTEVDGVSLHSSQAVGGEWYDRHTRNAIGVELVISPVTYRKRLILAPAGDCCSLYREASSVCKVAYGAVDRDHQCC